MKNWAFEKSIVIFGAGKIGRSFIGQLFSRAGYHIIFIDIDQGIISELNRRKSYQVVIKSDKDEVIEINNVSGLKSNDQEAIIDAIARCNLMAISVGKNAFDKILSVIAMGVEKRIAIQPEYPIDIILAENIRDCSKILKAALFAFLPQDFPLDSYVGLIETSIGKMVPIIPKEISDKDPLIVYAEPYNTLILGKHEFRNSIPVVDGLSPKENIKAWVDRKAFIHNLGHAAAAYYGHYLFPESNYLYEVLADPVVNLFTHQVMEQSARALTKEYPDEFSWDDLLLHIDDLILRFQNKGLGDTVFRVGQDLRRKLNVDDRVGGAIKMAQKVSVPFDKLIEVFAFGLVFGAKDESGRYYEDDIKFLDEFEKDPVDLLTSVCGFNIQTDKIIIKSILEKYKSILNER